MASRGEPRCRVCHCTELEPCEPPCGWHESDLCTACAIAPVLSVRCPECFAGAGDRCFDHDKPWYPDEDRRERQARPHAARYRELERVVSEAVATNERARTAALWAASGPMRRGRYARPA